MARAAENAVPGAVRGATAGVVNWNMPAETASSSASMSRPPASDDCSKRVRTPNSAERDAPDDASTRRYFVIARALLGSLESTGLASWLRSAVDMVMFLPYSAGGGVRLSLVSGG